MKHIFLFLILTSLFLFEVNNNNYAQFKTAPKPILSNNPKPKEAQVGIMGNGSVALHNYLYKGEAKNLGNYGITYSEGEDRNSDGIYEIYNYQLITSSNLKWLSFQTSYQVDSRLIPYQGGYSTTYFVDATNLSVGSTYVFGSGACNEIGVGGNVSGRACVEEPGRYVHIIPYSIPISQIVSVNGSFSNFQISWTEPTPLYCSIDHYELYRRDDDSVRITELNLSERVNGNISPSSRSLDFSFGKRNINSYYAVVCYDKYGEAIGISRSYKVTIPSSSFSLLTPNDGQVLTINTPTLDWNDYGTGNTYKLTISENQDFSSPIIATGIAQSQYTFTSDLTDHKTYFWKIEVEGESITSNETGWNFKINNANVTPSSFTLSTPIDLANTDSKMPRIEWNESSDEGDNVSYNLIISANNDFSNPIINTTTYTNYYWVNTTLNDDTQYYWKVKAVDTQSSLRWSDEKSFTTRYNDYPTNFSLLTPKYNGGVYITDERPVETGLTPTFTWDASSDPDPSATITYTLWYSTDVTFNTKTEVTGLTTNQFTPVTSLEEDRQYYWKVFAVDNSGNQTQNVGKPFSFVTNSENFNPQSFSLQSPSNNEVLLPEENKVFSWASSTDNDIYDMKMYLVEISDNSSFNNLVYTTTIREINQVAVPAQLAGNYYWRVVETSLSQSGQDGGSVQSVTHQFSVAPRQINIIRPLLISKLPINTRYIVSWNANYSLSNVKIEYSTNDGANWSVLEENYANANYLYRWTIPNVISTTMRLKITDQSRNDVSVISQTLNLISNEFDDSRLKLYLPFRNNVLDSSGNALIGINSGNTRMANDRHNNSNSAIDFYGIDSLTSSRNPIEPYTFSRIDFSSIALDLSAGYTISFWVKIQAPTNTAGNHSRHYFFWSDAPTNVSFYYYTWENQCVLIHGNSSISFPGIFNYEEWTFVTIKQSNDGYVTIYKNGDIVKEGTLDKIVEPIQDLRIGLGALSWAYLLNGQMDELKIYSVPLSNEEIGTLTAALPVELTSFNADAVDNKVLLKWSTATEINNYGFNVERNSSNKDWNKIGFIRGFGNSNSPKDYSFNDEMPLSGTMQYRLKQIDFDGKFEYSPIVEVEIVTPKQFSLNQNFPNPFNPMTTIKYELPHKCLVSLKVYDVLGKEVTTLIEEENLAGRYEINFDGSKLSSGVYFYQIRSGSFSQTKKLLLMK